MVKLKAGAGSIMELHGSARDGRVYCCSILADTVEAAPE